MTWTPGRPSPSKAAATLVGYLNGLPNFLDIFRTLNSLLFAYHSRAMKKGNPVIPFGFVTTYVMTNLELLIGPFEEREDAFDGRGFVAAIYGNFAGDKGLVRDRLKEERVPQMVCAAVEAMVAVRASARRLPTVDDWAARRLWVAATPRIAESGMQKNYNFLYDPDGKAAQRRTTQP